MTTIYNISYCLVFSDIDSLNLPFNFPSNYTIKSLCSFSDETLSKMFISEKIKEIYNSLIKWIGDRTNLFEINYCDNRLHFNTKSDLNYSYFEINFYIESVKLDDMTNFDKPIF